MQKMIITVILALSFCNRLSTEIISSPTWSNIVQDLSSKIHDYKSDEKNMESHPINEGFMLLSDNLKKPPRLSPVKKGIFPSPNISTTTCTTAIVIKTTKPNSSVSGRVGRRLLNEPSYDTDIDTSSLTTTTIQTPVDHVDDKDTEIGHFLKVDDEELSQQMLNMVMATDGSGETTEETTEQTSETTTTSLAPTSSTTTTTGEIPDPVLSNNTKFILTMDCANANTTLTELLEEFHRASVYPYNVSYNESELDCTAPEKINVTLDFISDNNVTIINSIFENLGNISASKGIPVYSANVCGDNKIVLLDKISSCYIIDQCHLCGTPQRGACLPEDKLSKCRCFSNDADPSQPYVGDFCKPPNTKPTTSPSIPARWTPIIVGILAGVTGLFLAITCCLWALAIWRQRRRSPAADDLRIFRLWHLPRAQVPTAVTNENVQSYITNTISTSTSNRTDSDSSRSNITDSTFFKELDQRMGENLRATITRPNTQAMLASLPSDTISTLSSTYDPIDELDAIIDNEDLNTTFHDPLNELYEDDDMLEFVNPNIKLPRPNVDNAPRGLFSFFHKGT